jgi:hypothetical protein
MKDIGYKYYFEESRSCSLCGENEYYTDNWSTGEKSRYVIVKDSQKRKFQIIIRNSFSKKLRLEYRYESKV